jgi:hypothetical protein
MAENPQNPQIDRFQLGQSNPSTFVNQFDEKPMPKFEAPVRTLPGGQPGGMDPLAQLNASVMGAQTPDGPLMGGSITHSLANVSSDRYNFVLPGYDNEDIYGTGQSWLDKAANGIVKGLTLAGTTFLQSTVGLVNGILQAATDGRFASFYDNDFNRALDDFTKKMENWMPNYYSLTERNAEWYSPANLFSANFIFDKIIKNLGFAAGAYLSGNVFAAGLRNIGLTARIMSTGKLGEAVNATENALLAQLPRAERFAAMTKNISTLAKSTTSTYNILDKSQRAVVAGLSITGEAGFEALHNMNEFRDAKIQEYREKNGVLPIGEELEKINEMAEGVGNTSMFLNMGLLTATQYIQMPKVIGSSYRGEKSAINNAVRETKNIVQDQATREFAQAPQKFFGKATNRLSNFGKYLFSPSEAFEEGMQTSISFGTKEYYGKKYRGDKDANFLEDVFGYGIGKTLNTKEGIESILIGGISGRIMENAGQLSQGKLAFGDILTGRDSREIRRNTTELIGNLNRYKFTGFMKESVDNYNRGMSIQEDRQEAIRQGDVLESKDLEADYLHNYISHRIKFGRGDLIMHDINDYRQLASTPEGWQQLQTDGIVTATETPDSFLARLQNLETHTKNVKNMYEALNIRYAGKVDADGKRLYPDEVIDKMVYASSKIGDYDARLKQLAGALLVAGVPVDEAVLQSLTMKEKDDQPLRDQAVTKAIVDGMSKIQELNIIDEAKDELKQQFLDYFELNMRRQSFIDEYKEMKEKPASFVDEPATPASGAVPPEDKLIEKVKVKTRDGEEEVEIGTEYYLGAVVEHDKNGREVYRFPTLKILGVNADGTIKIQASNGTIKDISPAELESYKLGKVSDTQRNKKAKFYMDNANTIFEFNFGKNRGGKKRGRLIYSPKEGILLFAYKTGKKNSFGHPDIRTIEVTGDMFKPKKGYNNPLISAVGKLTASQQEALESFASAKDDRMEAKRAARVAVIQTLADEAGANIEKITQRINEVQEELVKVNTELEQTAKDIETEEFKQNKSGSFKGVTKQNIMAAMKLTRLRDALQIELDDLTAQKAEQEFNLEYFVDMASNLDELPGETSGAEAFVDALKEDVNFIEDLILTTGDLINKATDSIKQLEDAIEEAIDNVLSNIKKFETKYPGAPTSAAPDVLNLFLQQNPNFLRLKPDFLADLKKLEELIATVEDKKIKPNEKGIRRLTGKIERANKTLTELEKLYHAKNVVLQKFESTLKEYREQKAREERLKRDETLRKAIFGDQAEVEKASGETVTGDPVADAAAADWEDARKDAAILFTSTTTPSKDLKPHHHREQYFLNNIENHPKRANMKVMFVTRKNETKFGLQGLIDKLLGTYTIDPAKEAEEGVVAAVYIEQEGENYYFVDAKGDRLSEVGTYPDLDRAVFSVMPSANLETPSTGPRYRSKQKAEAEAALEGWKVKRKELLALEGTTEIHDFSISRGIPQTDKEEKSALQADLIDRSDLERQGTVVVSTGIVQTANGVNINIPAGRPMLVKGSNVVFLNNRNMLEEEQDTVYELIFALVQNFEKTDKLDRRITTFLQGLLYWRVARENDAVGRNQIWIGHDGMLHMGKNGVAIPFTSGSIVRNEEVIKAYLKGTYVNVNNAHLKAETFNKPFEEITDVTDNGEIQSVTWKSYQHYLLSETYDLADESHPLHGKRREPLLSTNVRPLDKTTYSDTDGAVHQDRPGDYNMEGKYATLQKLDLPKIEPKKPEKVQEPAPKAPISTGLGLTLEIPKVGKVKYNLRTIDGKEVVTLDMEDAGTKAVVAAVKKRTDILNGFRTNPEFAEVSDEDLAMMIVEGQVYRLKNSAPTPVIENKATFVKDGTTVNKVAIKGFGEISFTINETEEVLLQDDEATKAAIEKLAANKNLINAQRESDPAYAVYNDTAMAVGILQGQAIRKVREGVSITPPAAPIKPAAGPKPSIGEIFNKVKDADPSNNDPKTAFRVVTESHATPEQWDKVEAYMKKILPQVPVHRVRTLLRTTAGGWAWGKFERAAITVFEGAETGSTYHEAFEAVWAMFTEDAEKQAIIEEFNKRKGVFRDRETGKIVPYMLASAHQAKEQIAEEFRDYALQRQEPQGFVQRMIRWFRDLINTVRNLIYGSPSHVTELFRKIDGGYFKGLTPVMTEGTEYREAIINQQITYELVQDVTARVLRRLLGEDGSKAFFNLDTSLTKSQIYGRIKEEFDAEIASHIKSYQRLWENAKTAQEKADIETTVQQINDYWEAINNGWQGLVRRNTEFLRTFNIVFEDDEDSAMTINTEGANRNDYARDAFQHDAKKNAPTAIRLLFATLVETYYPAKESNTVDPTAKAAPGVLQNPVVRESSIGGFKLADFSKGFVQVLDSLANTNGLERMIDKLVELAKNHPNYVALFKRLKGNITNGKIDYDKMNFHDWQLLISFYNTFQKQKPEALIQYIDENAKQYTSSGNLNTVAKELQEEWIENLKDKAQRKDGLLILNASTRKYEIHIPKLEKLPLKYESQQVKFLDELGIGFSTDMYYKLNTTERTQFAKAVSAIRSTLVKRGKDWNIAKINERTLDMKGHYTKLSELAARVSKPHLSSTAFNVDNERVQIYVQNNVLSVLESDFNTVATLDELLKLRPELTDVFAMNSQVLKKGGIFFDRSGVRTNEPLKLGYIGGTVDQTANNPKRPTDKLTVPERLMQEINQNLNGWYYTLVPADSSTEWMMSLGNHVTIDEMAQPGTKDKIMSIFRGYLEDEVALARANRSFLPLIGKRAQSLRFFDGIIDDQSLKNKILEQGVTDELWKKASDHVSEFLRKTTIETRTKLESYDLIHDNGDGTFGWNIDQNFADFHKLETGKLSADELSQLLGMVNVNYIINNIELHKLVFGDPYIYKDPTKRFKSFMSPRETSIQSEEFDKWANNNLNKVGDVQMTPNTLGYHTFKPYITTITSDDVEVVGSLGVEGNSEYDDVNEADASTWISPVAYREFRIKNARWSEKDEMQFQYEMALTRNSLQKEMKEMGFAYPEELKKADIAILKKGNPHHHTWYVLKPIGTGVKEGSTFIDNILDKTSMAPLIYSQVKDFPNAKKQMLRMLRDNTGYKIVKSGRKVGYTDLVPMYNPDGSFNDTPMTPVQHINVPFKAIGVQVETSSHGENSQTRGTQVTKLATVDLLENGKPVDVDISLQDWAKLSEEQKRKASAVYSAVKHNQDILEKMTEHGYHTLLNRLGVKDTGNGFVIEDITKTRNTLRDELLRRDANDNIKESLDVNPQTGQFVLPFEATASYQTVKNVLFSIIDKTVVKPKMNGGPKVQVSATLWEKNNRQAVYKTKDGWKKVEDYSKLTDAQKKTVRLTSNDLKFYTKDAPYMEVYLPNWFAKKLRKGGRILSDSELIEWMNSKEGQKVLTGIGFRIPTQGPNSIEVFRVKGFLPEEMGDTIIVPSEITKKAGSDFDIDKLQTYLKNIYIDKDGLPREIPFFGFDEMAKAKIKGWDLLNLTKTQAKEALDDLTDEDLADDNSGEEHIDKLYRQSLENEYYNSLATILTLPQYYERMITPNSEGKLKPLRDKLRKLLGLPSADVFNTTDLLRREYMSQTRHNFIVGKGGVGIAAIQQTNHSLNQRSVVYLDRDRIMDMDPQDIFWLTGKSTGVTPDDLNILLPHNTVTINGKKYASLSGIKDQAQDYISDKISAYINGYVDISKDTFIVEIGASPNVAGTFMFLEKLGVPTETVVLFMNQPIIREYLRTLDKNGSSWLFGGDSYNEVLNQFASTVEVPTELPGRGLNKHFETMISKAYKEGVYQNTLSEAEKAEQQLILREFLKYAMLASHQFEVNQSTNFDTAQLNDPALSVRKEEMIKRVRQRNIISSVDDILSNSFLGSLRERHGQARDVIGLFMKMEQPGIRALLANVISHFTQRGQAIQDKKFLQISKNIVSSFIDYLTQTESGLNNRIPEILLNPSTSVASKITRLKSKVDQKNADLAQNPAIQAMQPIISDTVDGVRNIKLKAKDKDVFTENTLIEAFRELRDTVASRSENGEKAYERLVDLALLQSGTTTSPISFTHLIPLEDYAARVAPIIDRLDRISDKMQFVKTGAFFRNNWKDTTIVPAVKTKAYMYKIHNSLKKMAGENTGQLIKIVANARAAKMPFIKVRRATKVGNEVIWNTLLFKRVEYSDGTPLIMDPNFPSYLYKQVNAWGDGFNGQEYYKQPRPSVIDNGTLKVKEELDDAKLIEIYNGLPQAKAPPTEGFPIVPMRTENVDKVISGRKTLTNRKENLSDGIYKIKNTEVFINLKNLGRAYTETLGGITFEDGKTSMRDDEFAYREGFEDWKDFAKNNKYSADFVNGKESRYIYEISHNKDIKNKC